MRASRTGPADSSAGSSAGPASPLALLAAPVVVVAHDAGGAEILSSLLRRAGPALAGTCRLVLEGPARAVFERKLEHQATLPLHQALAGAGSVLTGSGWQSTLETDALRLARPQGLPSVAFIDHWVNYRERFVRQGQACLPNELWVGDDDACRLARECLPDLPLRLVPNPYFADVRDELAALAAPAAQRCAGSRLLYVCEPVREPALRMHGNPRHWGYTEEEALAFALEQLPRIGLDIADLRLRPHPSEALDKYDAQLAASAWPAQRGGDRSLLAEIADSDIVVGLNSMAMVIALLGGKRVLCAIPPGGAACVLPQRGIEMLHPPVRPGA